MRIFILVILLCFSVVSQAATMHTRGTWYNAAGDHEGEGIHIDNNVDNDIKESRIHWGSSTNPVADSSYNFTRTHTFDIKKYLASENAFKIGKFDHINNGVVDDPLTEVKLKVNFKSSEFYEFDYHLQFTHNAGDNSDEVTLSSITKNVTIKRGGDTYQLNIFGFKESASDANYTDNLSTAKDESTSTFIWAQFTKVNVNVPEPTPLALMSLGLVGLLARKKFLQS